VLLWSGLGPAPPFPPMRVLEVYWSRAHNLVYEMTLRQLVRPLDESWGPSQLHGHGPWLVCVMALRQLVRPLDENRGPSQLHGHGPWPWFCRWITWQRGTLNIPSRGDSSLLHHCRPRRMCSRIWTYWRPRVCKFGGKDFEWWLSSRWEGHSTNSDIFLILPPPPPPQDICGSLQVNH
jgi:hypothetical protein